MIFKGQTRFRAIIAAYPFLIFLIIKYYYKPQKKVAQIITVDNSGIVPGVSLIKSESRAYYGRNGIQGQSDLK
ncbi:hypothetical protein C4572_00845 [Candidatus Parcubacteria bacterium]|nr:MAG: hypothetical protein C4572_00845 [Candidatus Parcubacteria bacterium]